MTEVTATARPFFRDEDGLKVYRTDFPDKVQHWTPLWKKRVLRALKGGIFTYQDVASKYFISEEEIRHWARPMAFGGMEALRASRVKEFRKKMEIARDALPSRIRGLKDRVEVLKAIECGVLSEEEACETYSITLAALRLWEKQVSDLNTSNRLTRSV